MSDFAHFRTTRQTAEDDRRAKVLEFRDQFRAVLFHVPLGRTGSSVPHTGRAEFLVQVTCHGIAHSANPDETNVVPLSILNGRRGGSGRSGETFPAVLSVVVRRRY